MGAGEDLRTGIAWLCSKLSALPRGSFRWKGTKLLGTAPTGTAECWNHGSSGLATKCEKHGVCQAEMQAPNQPVLQAESAIIAAMNFAPLHCSFAVMLPFKS